MKKVQLAGVCVLALLLTQSAVAESGYRLGFEYEAEKEKASGAWSDTGYIIPAFTIRDNALIDRVELLLGYSQPRAANEGAGASKAFGVRIHKNIPLADNVKAFVRAAVGHNYMPKGAADFNWGYIEPGIEVKLNHTFGFAVSDRLQNSVDGTKGQRVNSVRVGPNIEFNEQNELELRYISTTGDYESDSVMAEYVLKF